jgi:hypothetical protein
MILERLGGLINFELLSPKSYAKSINLSSKHLSRSFVYLLNTSTI